MMTTLAYMKGIRVRRLPIGFSWTTLFFGCMPSAIRQHWSFVFVSMGFSLIGMYASIFVFHGFDMFLSFLTFRLLAAAIRNAHLHDHARMTGWTLKDPASVHVLSPSNDP